MMDRNTSAPATSASSSATTLMPAFSASLRVRSLRPARHVDTAAPPSRSSRPVALPMSPVATIATRVLISGTPPFHEADELAGHDHLVALVEGLEQPHDDATVGLGFRRPRVAHGDPAMDGVAGKHRPRPAHLVEAGAAEIVLERAQLGEQPEAQRD